MNRIVDEISDYSVKKVNDIMRNLLLRYGVNPFDENEIRLRVTAIRSNTNPCVHCIFIDGKEIGRFITDGWMENNVDGALSFKWETRFIETKEGEHEQRD